jgi:SAM-dependent methyltransferase
MLPELAFGRDDKPDARAIERVRAWAQSVVFNGPAGHGAGELNWLLVGDGAYSEGFSRESLSGRWLRVGAEQGLAQRRKLGFRYALDHGFERVLVLDRACDWSREQVLALSEVAHEADADLLCVPASGGASGGGSLLSGLWSRLASRLSRSLREADDGGLCYPMSMVACSHRLLSRVPFEVNSEGELFDAELFLQACYVGAAVRVLPAQALATLPVGGGAKGSGGWSALVALVQFRLHQQGMFCSLKYRDLAPLRYQDKTGVLYSSHEMALRKVQEWIPRRLLDIGCGPGFVANRCAQMGVKVTGLDLLEPLPGMVSEFHKADLNSSKLPVNAWDFDMILLLDVIEHLHEPERFLLGIRHAAAEVEGIFRGSGGDETAVDAPVLVLSTPNIAFATIRLNLLLGRFNYAERGILDISHCRLFTRSSLRTTLEDCGYIVESIEPVPVPFGAVMRSRLGRVLGAFSAWLAWCWPTLFAFQWLVVCRPKPGLGQVLKRAMVRV